MTKKEFFKAVSNGEEDVIQIFLDALSTANVDYCVIGGLVHSRGVTSSFLTKVKNEDVTPLFS